MQIAKLVSDIVSYKGQIKFDTPPLGRTAAVDDWSQKDLRSRAEAIRRLVELGAKLKTTSERGS